MKVVIALSHPFELWNAPAWLAERLGRDFPKVSFRDLGGYEGLDREIVDAEVLFGWSLRPQQLAAARTLRWVHSPAAAVHQLIFPEMIASAVVLTNAREVHGPVVAEHAIALVLALAKRLPSAMRCQQRHVWGQQEMWQERPRPREVQDATLGLIGLGSIGREVAKRARALGMRVVAVREHPQKGSDGADAVHGPAETDRMLAQADYVVIAAPITSATQFLFDAERLAHMKPDACLINVSRGQLVDEAALADALRRKKIAGAALDVFSVEPLPPESPLWELDNLLITPHTAAVTEKLWERHYALMRENLRRYLAGEALLGMVDKLKGY
ncbi:MAG TPA: D-2-hydroxyacid dehydrogenase [Terriglobales bacterium]|nr:D-2-hydroxyacid dehydrogenase [Terriglobales bacterium]